MAISVLPSDVLIALFGTLSSSQDRLNATLVCREWHVIAKPVLYRDLSLAYPQQVQNIARTMKSLTQKGETIGHLIQSIAIESSAIDTYVYQAVFDALLIICFEAVNVQSLNISGPLAFTAINIVSRVPDPQLRSLSLTVDDCTSLSAFEHIHVFQHLQKLSIYGQSDSDGVTEMFDDLRAWALTELRELQINAEQRWASSFAQFLLKCTFPALEKFGYDIPAVRNDNSSRNLALFLAKFERLKEASIHVRGLDHTMILPHIHASTLELRPLKPEYIRALSKFTRCIKISISVAIEESKALWKVLDAMITQRTSIKSVQIVGNDFSWMVGPDKSGKSSLSLLPYLMRYATLLADKGIALRDSHSKTLLDYFPKDCQT